MPRTVLPPELRDASDEERADLEQVWARLGDAPAETTHAETDAAWDRLASRLRLDAEPAPTEPSHRRRAADRAARPRRRRLPTRWIATGVTALAFIAMVALTAPTLVAPVSVQAAPGTTEAVTLPDGSTVTLAPGSRVTYAKRFGALLGAPETRQVALVGEGFFDVESGDAPFVVTTFNAEVQVLGTRFGVRAHWREDATRVTVEEGAVQVTAAGESVRLGAEEATVVMGDEAAPTAPEAIDAERALAWIDGGLSFDDLSLADAFAEIERRYGVTVDTDGNVPASADVTAFYARAPDVRTVLGDLCAAHGLRFEATSRGFAVSASGSSPRDARQPGASRPSRTSSASPR